MTSSSCAAADVAAMHRWIQAARLGEKNTTGASAIAVDADSFAYVTGVTNPVYFETTTDPFDSTLNGVFEAFILKLSFPAN